jgi:predicted permease
VGGVLQKLTTYTLLPLNKNQLKQAFQLSTHYSNSTHVGFAHCPTPLITTNNHSRTMRPFAFFSILTATLIATSGVAAYVSLPKTHTKVQQTNLET